MNKLLIGSAAIRKHFADFPREPKDIDYAVDDESFAGVEKGEKRTEYLYNPIIDYSDGVASPELLLTLKVSHLAHHPKQFDKTMHDIQYLLDRGSKIDQKLFLELYEFWDDHLGVNRRSDLKMGKEEFFDNAVNNEIDHDYIHTLINPNPTYKKTLKDGCEVETEESKFWELSEEDKLNLIFEEVEVMAYERFHENIWQIRYIKMMKKFVCGHCPLYMTPFICYNWKQLHKPRRNFIEIIEKGLA